GVFAFRCPLEKTLPVLGRCAGSGQWSFWRDYPHAAVHALRKTPPPGRAAFWVVTGKYLPEAERSARSLARVMAGLGRWLFSPADAGAAPAFDQVRRLPAPGSGPWYAAFCRGVVAAMEQMGAERLLMLDSDTFFLEEVHELFDLLENFDIAGTHAVGR